MRGGLIGVNQLAINCGITLAFALGLPAVGLSWRALSAAALIPVAALFVGALVVPESPRWLASAGRGEEAAEALRRLRGRADVTAELRAIQAGLAQAAAEPAPTLNDFAGRPALARPLRIVLIFMILQQLTGIKCATTCALTHLGCAFLLTALPPPKPSCVFFNVAPIFAAAGLPGADASALAVMAPQILVSTAACLLMDAAGRRPLLLWASSVMAISAALLGVSFSLPASAGAAAHPLALVGTFVFVSAFSVGMGPIPWVLMGELFPPRVRGVAASASTAVSNIAAFVVTVSFGAMVRLMGMGLAFFFYAACCAGCWAFTFFALPETKGRSLEQIGALLASDANPWDEPPPIEAEDGEEGAQKTA